MEEKSIKANSTKLSNQGEPLKRELTNVDKNLDLTKQEHNTGSSFGAYFNIICVIMGTGTLGIPYAVKEGGWITLLFLVISAIISFYSGVLLIQCLYYKEGKRLTGFPEIGYEAFGNIGKFVVEVFTYILLVGPACLYIILTGLSVNALLIPLGVNMGLKFWILMAGILILIPYIIFKTLKEVAILSIFGALATIFVIIVASVLGLVDFNKKDFEKNHHDIIKLEGIPLSIATMAFSFGGNVVYPHVEQSMKNPKKFNMVLLMSVLTIFLGYFLIAIIGYLVYGENVKSPILESLPNGIVDNIAIIVITLHVILAAPIYLCTFSLEIENKLNLDKLSNKAEFLVRSGLRTIVMAVVVLIAMFVPYFNDVMSLLGALGNGTMLFIVPLACHVKLFGISKRPYWEYALMIVIVVFGVLCCVLGSIKAVEALVLDFKGKGNPSKVSH